MRSASNPSRCHVSLFGLGYQDIHLCRVLLDNQYDTVTSPGPLFLASHCDVIGGGKIPEFQGDFRLCGLFCAFARGQIGQVEISGKYLNS